MNYRVVTAGCLSMMMSLYGCGGGASSPDAGPDIEVAEITDIGEREDLDEMLNFDQMSAVLLGTNADYDDEVPVWKCDSDAEPASCMIFGGIANDTISGQGMSWDINAASRNAFDYVVTSRDSVALNYSEPAAQNSLSGITFAGEQSFTSAGSGGVELRCNRVTLGNCPYQE